eukprot:1573234-Alexandrium_andersonii.AAC.1
MRTAGTATLRSPARRHRPAPSPGRPATSGSRGAPSPRRHCPTDGPVAWGRGDRPGSTNEPPPRLG